MDFFLNMATLPPNLCVKAYCERGSANYIVYAHIPVEFWQQQIK